ncbi:hypothetical protein SDC9_199158 [bioreactor metagenome]|uniref:Uncharacterized protein n=1 Tax=bioreactor metagenome TaxID=1076179 RepID=A0A645IK58_9ZZZZ
MFQKLTFATQCLKMVGKENIESKTNRDRNGPWIKVEPAAVLENQPYSSNSGTEQNTGF